MSTNEIIIEIEPGDAGYRILLGANGARTSFRRARLPTLDQEQLDEIREGQPKLATISRVATAVSNWLLSTEVAGGDAVRDLGPQLQTMLAAGNARIVIRHDWEIAPKLLDIPFELLEVNPGNRLIMENNIRALVHEVEQVNGGFAPIGIPESWPLEILLVRAQPNNLDFDEVVPLLAPIAAAIRQSADALGADVHLTCLTSEPGAGADGLPTLSDLGDAVKKKTPHIFVFLGHGGVEPYFTGSTLPSFIYLEDKNGGTEQVPAGLLRNKLHSDTKAVPVVILTGCLTAASPGTIVSPPRGVQGMAQTLVDGATGIRVAVGTRSRITNKNAETFLKKFFDSLLRVRPGDIEAGVRLAREELEAEGPHTFACCAPVVFRRGDATFQLDFLRNPPVPLLKPTSEDMKALALRRKTWESLASLPPMLRGSPLELGIRSLLETIESDSVFRRAADEGRALVMPARVESAVPNIELAVELHGAVRFERLEGRLRIPSGALVTSVKRGAAAAAAGMRLSHSEDDPSVVDFVLHQPTGAVDLAGGRLIELQIQIEGAAQRLYELSVELSVVVPAAKILGETNAVFFFPS